jgi:hypothetical protein
MIGRMRHLFSVIVVAVIVGSVAQARAEQTIAYGNMIHQAKLEGFSLHYHLLSWKERNILMKGMEGMAMPGVDLSGKATHHLLLYLQGVDGKSIPSAKVGFKITASDGSAQTTLTMEMQGGYGADVVMPTHGKYVVKLKAVLGEQVLVDEFTFTLK